MSEAMTVEAAAFAAPPLFTHGVKLLQKRTFSIYSRVPNNRVNTLMLILRNITQHGLIRRKHEPRRKAPRRENFEKCFGKQEVF